MTRKYFSLLLAIGLLLCLFSCSTAEKQAFDTPEYRAAYWYNSYGIPPLPQPIDFSSSEEMLYALSSKDLVNFGFEEGSEGSDEEKYTIKGETRWAYMHMIYSLWGARYVPVLQDQALDCVQLYPLNRNESVKICYRYFLQDETEVRVYFELKDAVNVSSYRDKYEKQGTTITIGDREYCGFFEKTTKIGHNDLCFFTINYSNNFYMRVRVVSDDAYSAKDICEIIHGLKIHSEDLYE